jgi:Mor family transcriptional regulator
LARIRWRMKKKPPIERFEEKFAKTEGCWIWAAFIAPNGYGLFYDGERDVGAHRYSYAAYVGQIPQGLIVRHKCDVPACVRPDHLHLGTQAENIQDKITKKRQSKGAKIGNAKLTEDQIVALRSAYEAGASGHALATQFSISPAHVYKILRGQLWAHVNGAQPDLVTARRTEYVGQNRTQSKLNDSKVREIRQLFANGASGLELAERYGVSASLINGVVSGKRWKHVT